MNRGRFVGVVVVLLVGGWLLAHWYSSPERQINRNLRQLQKLVAKAPAEDSLTALGKARSVGEMFSDEFEFSAEQFSFSTRDRQQLTVGVHQYRSRAQAMAVQIRDRELSVSPEQGRATSHLTVVFLTQFRDVAGREAYRFQVNWKELDGEWLIDYVKLLEVLEDPDSAVF